MGGLLAISRGIDTVNETLGKLTAWLVLAAVLISAGNATTRKLFNLSSNAWLELQWYLFGVIFMIGAAWTMKLNEHVRVDVVSSKLSKKTRDKIEIFGLLVFFFPFALLHLYESYPFFMTSWRTQEWSTNAGGLIIWPAKFMILFGFFLLTLQGVSQLIKRFAIISGDLNEVDDMKEAAHAPPVAHELEMNPDQPDPITPNPKKH
jgi:TRAP-type mannitol/chloroaromatic compound transport system permease small subunit